MRIALGLAYDGSRFEGWQSQASGNTVQDCVEAALSAVANVPVRVVAAGRTDAGVHATGQVVHFDTTVARPASAWVRGANAHLPPGIAVQWSRPVDEAFHARFSARARTYHYILLDDPVRPAIFASQVGWFHLPLAVEPMREAAALLVGRHDFSSFRSSECQAKTPVREVSSLTIDRRGRYLVFAIRADAFLHHMVRNIVGALVYVGKGAHAVGRVRDILLARDRRVAPPTFGPAGLYLTDVEYDPALGIPAQSFPLPWLAP